MICPRCHEEIDSTDKLCPDCGARLYRNVSGVMKTSAVMISAGGEESFYQSVQDVPEPLRRQLMESTASENSGTIVIADRAGKEQLTQVLGRRESSRRTASEPVHEALAHLALTHHAAEEDLPEVPTEPHSVDRAAERWTKRLPWIAWAGFSAVLAMAAAFVAFFGMRW